LNAPTTEAEPLGRGRALLLPVAFAVVLAAIGFALRSSPVIGRSILGAAVFLTIWAVALGLSARASGRTFTLAVIPRKPHYVQLSTQAAIYLYWGWYVPLIRGFAVLILAQLVFAYGFSALLAWSRREHFELGFGPFPIIFSINLFLLFKPDWFYWQFGMIALGYLAKEFIRWEKNGRSTHIFNPSSFPLAIFSIGLIATNATDTTFGVDIATRLFDPPNIHAFLFAVSIPVQILFGVATMTVASVVTVYAFGVAFFAITGTYFFYEAYIPIAVFLGMHLLQTDPSTSPRTETGRVVYGMMYGLGVVVLVVVLRALEAPSFYDKLLPVLILNMMIQMVDRWVTSGPLRKLDLSAVAPQTTGIRRNLAIVGIWIAIFAGIYGAGGFRDDHPGQWIPFWQTACSEGSDRGCIYLASFQQDICIQGSGWACNELAVLLVQRNSGDGEALGALQAGCELGFDPACENGLRLSSGNRTLTSAVPTLDDLPLVIRGAKGPVTERDPDRLFARACEIGFEGTCQTASFASN